MRQLLDRLLKRWMDRFVARNGDKLLAAMQKVNEGGGEEDIDTIVEDYYQLLRAVYRGGKPAQVSLDPEEADVLLVDGACYDLDALICHNDQRNTGRRMEIEMLLSDRISAMEVERRLNEKVKREW